MNKKERERAPVTNWQSGNGDGDGIGGGDSVVNMEKSSAAFQYQCMRLYILYNIHMYCK